MRAPLVIALVLGALAPTAARAEDKAPPKITHVRVERVPIGEAVVIRARIDDESEVFAPSVLFRVADAPEFVTMEMTKKGDGYEATIPAELVNTKLEYFIEAFDEFGNGPAREGSPEAPIGIEVFDPARAPAVDPRIVPPKKKRKKKKDDDDGGILGTWWFWTGAGVLLIGGVVGVAALSGGGEVDFVDVIVRGPDPVEGL